MRVDEWVREAGFRKHPFAESLVRSRSEIDLGSYFVEPLNYEQVADPEFLRVSGIVHAVSGGGKSALCRMIADLIVDEAALPQPALVAFLKGWEWVARECGTGPFERAESHCRAIVASVLRAALDGGRCQSAAADVLGSLSWLAEYARGLLLRSEARDLKAIFDQREVTPVPPDLLGEHTAEPPAGAVLLALAETVRGLGYGCGWVLIDGIDEVPGVDTPEKVAELLRPLFSSRLFHTCDGLVFKYFILSDTLRTLQDEGRIDAPLEVLDIGWDELRLRRLLEYRLGHFSDSREIRTLNKLATAEVKAVADLDDLLVKAARGVPRQLILLGKRLFQECASRARDRAQIDQEMLAAFQATLKLDPAGARPRRKERPLDPEEVRRLVRIVKGLFDGPDADDMFNELIGNLDRDTFLSVKRNLAIIHRVNQLVNLVNHFNWQGRPLDHPLVVLIDEMLFQDGPWLERIDPIEQQWLKEVGARITGNG
jgi:hypothetical protein